MSRVRTKTDAAVDAAAPTANEIIAQPATKSLADAYAPLLKSLDSASHPLQMMTFSRTAKVLDVSNDTLGRWVDHGLLPKPIKLGTAQTRFFPVSVLREHIRRLLADQLKL